MARKATVKQARALRQAAPSTEQFLWKLLRDRRLAGLKFRRQFPLGPYVLDVVCLRHRLVIEADGPFHDPDHDARRDAWLSARGFRVLRFRNSEFSTSRDFVDRILATTNQLPPIPSPPVGEGGPRSGPDEGSKGLSAILREDDAESGA